MKHTNKVILLLCLLAVVATGTNLVGAESPTPDSSNPAKIAPLVGKIVAVNKAEQTVTVNIKGQIYVFRISPQIAVKRNNQTVNVEDLAAGQEVSIVARGNKDGDFEITALTIDPSATPAEAAGPKPKPAKPNKPAGNGPPSPFPGKGNPANVSGPPVSPHK